MVPAIAALLFGLGLRSDFAALKSVVTSVSVDGEAWRELFFSVEDHGTSSTGWHHIELRGEIPTLPSGSGFQYFRVSVEAGEYPSRATPTRCSRLTR